NGTGGTSADVRRGTSANQTYTNNLFQDAIASGGTVTSGIPRRNVTNDYYLNITTPEPLFASTTPTDPNFLYPVSNSFAIAKGDNSLYSVVGDINTDVNLAGTPRLESTII